MKENKKNMINRNMRIGFTAEMRSTAPLYTTEIKILVRFLKFLINSYKLEKKS
jgi:hypothetical protein